MKAVITFELTGENTSLSEDEIKFKRETTSKLFNLSKLNCSI